MSIKEQLKTTLTLEKHYKEQTILTRCQYLKRCAEFLIEQIEAKHTNGLYVGQIVAETKEIEKAFYELQSVEGKIKMLSEIEEKEQE